MSTKRKLVMTWHMEDESVVTMVREYDTGPEAASILLEAAADELIGRGLEQEDEMWLVCTIISTLIARLLKRDTPESM